MTPIGDLLRQPPTRELVPPDPTLSARWHQHDYPSPLARWNSHPEYEIHLITRGHGRFIVGDFIGGFGPGHLVMVGPDLAHDWISDLPAGDVIKGRDIVFQFHGQWLDACLSLLPELRDLGPLRQRAQRGIEFSGSTAERGAAAVTRIGATTGLGRLTQIFHLLDVLADAPEHEYRVLSNEWIPAGADTSGAELVDTALEYIVANIDGPVRLTVAANMAGLSVSAFSKLFKRAAGQTFSEVTARIRFEKACRLLEHTDEPVSRIAQKVGYRNLSNFNRQFQQRFSMTPTQYRRGGPAS